MKNMSRRTKGMYGRAKDPQLRLPRKTRRRHQSPSLSPSHQGVLQHAYRLPHHYPVNNVVCLSLPLHHTAPHLSLRLQASSDRLLQQQHLLLLPRNWRLGR